jgi:SAM-dependent methyltransferase
MLVQFIPFAVVLGLDLARASLGPILRRRGRRKYRAAAVHVPAGARLLDIGSGEGYVALEAARRGHDVVLVDVVDRNRTDLEHHVYDGDHLPFEQKQFDVGILAYVLHHCRDPDAVLREASRVCRRLIVLESVYENDGDLRLLTFLDHLANRFRGIAIEPLRFDKVEGWRRRFAECELRVAEERWLGRFVHKHVLFVLDSPAASEEPTRR